MKNLKRATFGLSFLIALLCLQGCSRYTNEDIVRDAKYCTDSGFDYEIIDSGFNSKPVSTVCKKKT